MCASTMPGTRRRPVRVFLLSGHALLRHSLAELLLQEGFEVIGEADSIASALPHAAEVAPDVVLVENRMSDGTGIEACRALRTVAPRTRCLIVTTYEEEMALCGAVMAGAAGYVLQRASAAGLPEKIRRVAAGEQLHSPEAAQAVRNMLAAHPLPGATAVEHAVLSLILQGRTNLQIGEELGLPQHTLAGHLSSLLAKLGYRPAPEWP
jgi:DNA-binding NarL/FixJ family response regulator